jgi:hypothetical protein
MPMVMAVSIRATYMGDPLLQLTPKRKVPAVVPVVRSTVPVESEYACITPLESRQCHTPAAMV